MKQTPIPEKIKPQYDKLGYPTGTWMYINSLIDVLTEQQKEIDLLKQMRTHDMSDHLLEWHIVEKTQPYTAMRSTGYPKDLKPQYCKEGEVDVEYCECESPGVCRLGNCPATHKCHYCLKPIKPQEYCKCKEPHVTDSAGMDIVHCISCGKEPSPIKPQEDIEKFVDYSIKKYKKTYKALGNSQEDIREKIADLYVDSVCDDSKCRIRHMHKAAGLELADRILAIVKGE